MKRASDVIAQGDLGQVVDYVIDLQRRFDQITKDLDLAKDYLRDEARKSRGSAFSVDLQGMTGTVTVTFPGLKLTLNKGSELQDLAVNLTKELFAKLVRRKIVVTPALSAEDWLEEVSSQPAEVQETIKHFVLVEEQTPKVYVPR